MERGPAFRCSVPKFPAKDSNHRILAPQRSRFTHDCYYLRDEKLGPMVLRVASLFPFPATCYLNGHSFIEPGLNPTRIGFRNSDNAFLAVDDPAALHAAAGRLSPELRARGAMNLRRFHAVNRIEYRRNFILERHFPIHRIFERRREMGLWRLTANKIVEIFGSRVTRKLKGRLDTTLERIERGRHTIRAYWKHAFVKRYEKCSTFPRNQVRSNNPTGFGPKKGLKHLGAVRKKFPAIADRFAAFQAQCLNVRVQFPLLQRLPPQRFRNQSFLASPNTSECLSLP
jgi:hypothetical protein